MPLTAAQVAGIRRALDKALDPFTTPCPRPTYPVPVRSDPTPRGAHLFRLPRNGGGATDGADGVLPGEDVMAIPNPRRERRPDVEEYEKAVREWAIGFGWCPAAEEHCTCPEHVASNWLYLLQDLLDPLLGLPDLLPRVTPDPDNPAPVGATQVLVWASMSRTKRERIRGPWRGRTLEECRVADDAAQGLHEVLSVKLTGDGDELEQFRRDVRAAVEAMLPPTHARREPKAVHPAVKPDGTFEGGTWLWWKGTRHDIPKGTLYKLLEWMWTRDFANYSTLDDTVFDSAQQPNTLRSRFCEANKILRKLNIPWKLVGDATSRVVRKNPQE